MPAKSRLVCHETGFFSRVAFAKRLATETMDSAINHAALADAKRTTAAAIRRIARTIPLSADRVFLISHASSLEAEAVELDKQALSASQKPALRLAAESD